MKKKKFALKLAVKIIDPSLPNPEKRLVAYAEEILKFLNNGIHKV